MDQMRAGNPPTLRWDTNREVSAMNRLSPLPIERALQIIGGRWKLFIVFHLQGGAQRLSELQRSVPGISQKMLIQQLRDLEQHGIVHRVVFAETPARVEYSLTEFGKTLGPIIQTLHQWGIDQSRAVGDLDRLKLCHPK